MNTQPFNPVHDSCPPTYEGAGSSEEEIFQVVQDSILRLWDVVDDLTQIRSPKHQRYRVTIFGSARLQPGDPLYEGVRHLASELTQIGCDIVTGGGPGLMQAANEGSVMADPNNQKQSIGLRVDLDFEQGANPFVEQVYHHRTFFSRLHHFALLSNAFVVVPGGIGTTLEALMVWQLLQVRKLQNTPLIMVGPMWMELMAWAKTHMVDREPRLASEIDIQTPHCVDTFEDAIAILRESYTCWAAKVT